MEHAFHHTAEEIPSDYDATMPSPRPLIDPKDMGMAYAAHPHSVPKALRAQIAELMHTSFGQAREEDPPYDGEAYWLQNAVGEVLSFMSIASSPHCNGQNVPTLWNLCTRPDVRGCGLMQTLLRRSLRHWAARHPTQQTLALRLFADNAPAYHIYTKFGFVHRATVLDKATGKRILMMDLSWPGKTIV